MNLAKNIVLQKMSDDVGLEYERIRVIWIDTNYEYVWVVNLKGEGSFPNRVLTADLEIALNTGAWQIITDPYLKVVNENKIPDNLKASRDFNWRVIEYLKKDNEQFLLVPRSRKEKIAEAAKLFELPEYKVARVLKRFWQRGMTKNSLIPSYDKCGGKGARKKSSAKKRGKPVEYLTDGELIIGINIDETVQKNIRYVIENFYDKKSKPKLTEAFDFLLKKFFSNKYVFDGKENYVVWDKSRIPKYNQFYYWVNKFYDFKDGFISRHGQREFDLTQRELLGNSTMQAFGPGSRYEIDATIADVYLVSSLDRTKVIGRPVCYAVIDVFSRLITGIYIGFEGPSWLGAMMALDNVVADKVEFCNRYGISISKEEWPSEYLPEVILADNGEFQGFGPEGLIENLNVAHENTSPVRPDLKGIVERYFRTVNEKIKRLTPGAVEKEFRVRCQENPALSATLTIEEFVKAFINLVLLHNSSVINDYPLDPKIAADGVLPIPIKLWEWGIVNRKGRFNYYPRDIIQLNLLPRAKANISREGIKFKGNFYSFDKAIVEGWFVDPKKKGSVDIMYDPRHMNYIYLPEDSGLSFHKATILDKSPYRNIMWEEEIEFFEMLKNEGLKENEVTQREINIHRDQEIREIVKGAKKKTQLEIKENPPKSKAQRIKEVRTNKGIERDLIRKKERFELAQKPPVDGKLIDVDFSAKDDMEKGDSDAQKVSPGKDMRSLILKLRDEKKSKNEEHDNG